MAMTIFSTPRQAMATLAKYSHEQVDRMVRTSERKYAETFGPEGERSSLNRPKTRWELLRLCAAVAGIEFCYAAETAFVSPIILRLHVPVTFMTLAWILSPLLGLVLNPLLGSISDRCHLKMGRRRPFILGLTLGVIVGLILVPNGQALGEAIGDDCYPFGSTSNLTFNQSYYVTPSSQPYALAIFNVMNSTLSDEGSDELGARDKLCLAGIIVTIIGVMILDFSCDASQSPCRTYLLDVCIPQDHNKGLSSFTVISGIGGFFGYIIGGVHWGSYVGQSTFTEHIRIVFGLAIVLHLVCIFLTVSSFPEVPLADITGSSQRHPADSKRTSDGKYRKFTNEDDCDEFDNGVVQGSYQFADDIADNAGDRNETHEASGTNNQTEGDKRLLSDYGTNNQPSDSNQDKDIVNNYHTFEKDSEGQIANQGGGDFDHAELTQDISLKTYLKSIFHLPKSIFWLCLTNLFSWMALLCYSLYFTDYVGQAVYGGDPTKPEGSPSHDAYASGVRLGSLAMSLYSLSCSLYSLVIERLVRRLGARTVYVGGQLVSAIGTTVMALSCHPVAVLVCSPTVGIIYATLFTMPYILLAHYHDRNVFDDLIPKSQSTVEIRGLGTDVALVSSMVFVGQVLLSVSMGLLVHLTGSTVTVVWSSAVLSLFGSLAALKVMYLDL